MTKTEKSQESRQNKKRLRPFGRSRKIFSVVACLILIFSLFTIPVSAADNSISSFLFYPNASFYSPDGFDSYVVFNDMNSAFYIVYFNNSDVGSTVTAKTYGTAYYEFTFPVGSKYYKFNDAASCFSFLRYGSSTCDVSSLATSVDNTNGFVRGVKNGVFLTNSSSMKTKYLTANGGPGFDESYYAYFNNVDSKQFILCFVTVSGLDSPVAIFTNIVPVYNSKTLELNCDGNMFFFYAPTKDDCIQFLKNEDGSALTQISKGKTLSNVTSFVASSCNISDIATGQVYFYSTGLEDELGTNSSSGELNPDGLDGKDKLDLDDIKTLSTVFNDIFEAIKSIPHLFDWLPHGFKAAIDTILVTFGIVLVILVALKIVHG